jgi:hypothetical protein
VVGCGNDRLFDHHGNIVAADLVLAEF